MRELHLCVRGQATRPGAVAGQRLPDEFAHGVLQKDLNQTERVVNHDSPRFAENVAGENGQTSTRRSVVLLVYRREGSGGVGSIEVWRSSGERVGDRARWIFVESEEASKKQQATPSGSTHQFNQFFSNAPV